MTQAKHRKAHLQSWIPPTIAWTTAPDLFAVEVPIEDPGVVAFIATGACEVSCYGRKHTGRGLARLLSLNGLGLKGHLEDAARKPTKLKPSGVRITQATKVVAYCHGVFLLPSQQALCVLVGRAKAEGLETWVSPALMAAANGLLLEHVANKATNQTDSTGRSEHPVLRIDPLLPQLPRATTFSHRISVGVDKLPRAAMAAVAASGWPPSRDGNYTGIVLGNAGRSTQGLLMWIPHTGLPSYPEVRSAAQMRIPAAFQKPRREQLSKPTFDTALPPSGNVTEVQGPDPLSPDITDALTDIELDQNDYRSRVDEIRRAIQSEGFEAIAWYQPYHVWTEETWGIFFDARKLDDLALCLLDDLKSAKVSGSHGLAALLAFGLTYAHELFHARVEAALSWMELNAQQPRHLRYNERVYQTLRETPDWLEEALANWSAWEWFKAPGIQPLVTRMTSKARVLNGIVENLLDISPPGYQDWRRGDEGATWRIFANQLSTGKPKPSSTGTGLPLESVLTGPLPYDFQPADIPLRFVGSGVIANRLNSHPATFNVPPRRELERALKHFQHSLDASGGKGGHQKWTGPDQRTFILPTRDPVSTGVFKTFLHHVGIDKATYVRQVRPNL